MNIQIKATNTTLTDAIKDAIHEKLTTIEPFLKSEDIVNVEIEESTKHQSGRFSRAEIHIVPHGYYADAQGNDAYEALDLVVPKIKDQLIKKKEKKISLRRRLGRMFKRNQ